MHSSPHRKFQKCAARVLIRPGSMDDNSAVRGIVKRSVKQSSIDSLVELVAQDSSNNNDDHLQIHRIFSLHCFVLANF